MSVYLYAKHIDWLSAAEREQYKTVVFQSRSRTIYYDVFIWCWGHLW